MGGYPQIPWQTKTKLYPYLILIVVGWVALQGLGGLRLHRRVEQRAELRGVIGGQLRPRPTRQAVPVGRRRPQRL